MPSATLATITVAMFIEMPRNPITPSTASTGSTLGAIVRKPNLTRSEDDEDHGEDGDERRAEAADLRRHQVVIERAEQPAGAGGRRGDAGAREDVGRQRVGSARSCSSTPSELIDASFTSICARE